MIKTPLEVGETIRNHFKKMREEAKERVVKEIPKTIEGQWNYVKNELEILKQHVKIGEELIEKGIATVEYQKKLIKMSEDTLKMLEKVGDIKV